MNSDKMQVYKGLEIVTNNITHDEKQGLRHYLLGESETDSDFTTEDFCLKSIVYIEKNLKTQCVPIIVGGSNSYIEKLVEDHVFMFKYKYDSCFIWIDVEQSVLNRKVDTMVDEMVNVGLVDEVWQIFIPDADYTKGIQRSIGVPEMARYLREVKNIDGDDESKKVILQASISSIKHCAAEDCSATLVEIADELGDPPFGQLIAFSVLPLASSHSGSLRGTVLLRGTDRRPADCSFPCLLIHFLQGFAYWNKGRLMSFRLLAKLNSAIRKIPFLVLFSPICSVLLLSVHGSIKTSNT
uniref:Isopentenyltransferase n=1 Tax=Solanum tuberosum TaxID=4113 RepID=M1DBI6_SOLTU